MAHASHVKCGSRAGASRFLIGPVTCFATHDGIPAVVRGAWRREVLGGIPTNSVERVLKVPSDKQPTAKQNIGDAEVATTQQRHRALDAPRDQVADGNSPWASRSWRLTCPADMCATRASASTSSAARKRESIQAHLTIVFAALAVTRFIEGRSVWSIKKFTRTTRRHRTIQIRAGHHVLTAEDPLHADLREALAQNT